jgi:FAD/FMN-containing dehydrogenase
MTSHQDSLQRLQTDLAGNTQPIRLKKRTVSNLFRYDGRKTSPARTIDLGEFSRPLAVDVANRTLDVQGLATYEDIVDFTLPHGLVPTITPELKHITVGGAIVGIGIESNCYRYGFVHDGLLEADVLLPDGRVVLCSPDNDHADLFFGLPNSYGTLGYVLRAKIRLRPVTPYVTLHTERLDTIDALVRAMEDAVDDPANDYIEGLLYRRDELYLTVERQTEQADRVTSIYGDTIFYREISRPGRVTLTTRDYLFRYDPEWFWALSESRPVQLFRRYAPARARSSGFYAHVYAWRKALEALSPFSRSDDGQFEKLIQDWEVPWRHAGALVAFALDTIDLAGRPLLAAAVKTPARASLYPMEPDQLYLNLGSYSYARKRAGQEPYYYTKVMDEFCFAHQGIKMLYSTTFLGQPEFDRIYGGAAYAGLKEKYDPHGVLPSLFEKAVQGR